MRWNNRAGHLRHLSGLRRVAFGGMSLAADQPLDLGHSAQQPRQEFALVVAPETPNLVHHIGMLALDPLTLAEYSRHRRPVRTGQPRA